MAFDLSVDVTRSAIETIQSGTVRRFAVNTFSKTMGKVPFISLIVTTTVNRFHYRLKCGIMTKCTFGSDSARTFETADDAVIIGVTRRPETSASGQTRIRRARIFIVIDHAHRVVIDWRRERISGNGRASGCQLVRLRNRMVMSPIFVVLAAGEFIIVIGARLFVFAEGSVSGCNFAQFPGSSRR